MARYQKTHIRDSNKNLWANLNSILKDFPTEISEKEYLIKKGGISTSPTTEGPEDLFFAAGLMIPFLIELIIYKRFSIAKFISETYHKRKLSKHSQELDFGRIPLRSLKMPNLKKWNIVVMEPYVIRRAIFGLLEICFLLDPSIYTDNERFKKKILFQPYKSKSSFLRALRIEPSLLQNKLGQEALEQFALWNRKDINRLGVALLPQKKAKIQGELNQSKINSDIGKALMVLNAIEPNISKLKDRELKDLLLEHGYCNSKMDENEIRKLRMRTIGSRKSA